MNIETVAENLRKTISGKEKFLKEVKQAVLNTQGTSHHVAATTARFLEINVDELKRILQDVEQCLSDKVNNASAGQ